MIIDEDFDDQDLEEIIVIPPMSEEQSLALEKQQKDKLEAFYSNNKKYEIEYWYDKLQQFTFPSQSFPLTVHEAYILYCRYYNTPLTQEDQLVQQKLEQKVEGVISSVKGFSQGVFMKLSTRSPKDYCWDYRDKEELENASEKLYEFLKIHHVNEKTAQLQLNTLLYKFFLINSKAKLSIDTASKFIQIFGKSDRIIIDMNDLAYMRGNLFTKMGNNQLNEEQKNQLFIKVWTRKWQQCEWSEEFRVFYHDYKVTGITQYDQNCFFPELLPKKQEILNKTLLYFESMKPKLQELALSEGVMDLVIKESTVKLIEINVFNHNARASLYDWKNEIDILKNGPAEVRLIEKQKFISKVQLGSMMGMIDKCSINVVENALKMLGLGQLAESFKE